MADQRLGTAEADRQAEQLERVEEAEGLGLAAVDAEGEGRSGAAGLALHQVVLARAGLGRGR